MNWWILVAMMLIAILAVTWAARAAIPPDPDLLSPAHDAPLPEPDPDFPLEDERSFEPDATSPVEEGPMPNDRQ